MKLLCSILLSNSNVNFLLFLQVMITAAGMAPISQVCNTLCYVFAYLYCQWF